MKRVLLVVILEFIGIIIGLIFFSKFVFKKYDYHIQKKQTFEIYKDDTHRDPNHRILKIYENGILINEIRHIDIHQIPRLQKNRVITINRYNVKYGEWWVLLYLLTVISVTIYLIIQIKHLKCYFSDGVAYGYLPEECDSKCHGKYKCKFYSQIENCDLTPAKTRFKSFWGYTN